MGWPQSLSRLLICRPWALCTPLFTLFSCHISSSQSIKNTTICRDIIIALLAGKWICATICPLVERASLCFGIWTDQFIADTESFIKKKLFICVFNLGRLYDCWSCNTQSHNMLNNSVVSQKLKWIMNLNLFVYSLLVPVLFFTLILHWLLNYFPKQNNWRIYYRARLQKIMNTFSIQHIDRELHFSQRKLH